MTNDEKLMQQALEALEMLANRPTEQALDYAENAIDALRERLARDDALDRMAENARELGLDYEPARQEPVAWIDEQGRIERHSYLFPRGVTVQPLYTTQQPLTDEEIKSLWVAYRAALPRYFCFARAIEAAHGIGEKK